MAIRIRSFPRLHFSLIDLSRAGFRMYGGVGMCVDALPIELTFERGQNTDLSMLGDCDYSRNDIVKLEVRLAKASASLGLDHGVTLVDAVGIRQHLGLGSGTRVALSAVEALLLLNNIPVEEDLVRRLSGRGGASGVGLHTYFHGGLSLDIGRTRTAMKFQSSDIQDGEFPLPITVCSLHTPKWPVILVMPKRPMPISLEKETEFFEMNTPVDDASVHEAAYTALFGVFGGAASNDISSFCDALRRLQELPWKKAETALHGGEFVERVGTLQSQPGMAVIMSSLGPTLACFGGTHQTLIEKMSSGLSDATVVSAYPRNEGREVLNA